MVNWNDPNVILQCCRIFTHIDLLLLGLYIWEYARSWQVEFNLFSRRIPLRWPLLPYIFGRVFLLISMVMVYWLSIPNFNTTNCYGFFLSFSFLVNAAIGCSSLNVMLRPFMIWKARCYIRIFLVLATIGQWIFLFRVMFGFSIMHVDGTCGVMVVDHIDMTTLFAYTIFYDILALVLTIIGLRNTPSSNVIARTLHKQGLIYVLLTCLANIVPTVISVLNLNDIMNVAFLLPATVISIIASSRIVVSLLDLQSNYTRGIAQQMGSRDVLLTTMLTLPTAGSTISMDVLRS